MTDWRNLTGPLHEQCLFNTEMVSQEASTTSVQEIELVIFFPHSNFFTVWPYLDIHPLCISPLVNTSFAYERILTSLSDLSVSYLSVKCTFCFSHHDYHMFYLVISIHHDDQHQVHENNIALSLHRVFLFDEMFLTTSRWCNFDDIDLRFFCKL